MYDCWNKIGIRGDRSCPEFKNYINCYNCPVFEKAGKRFFDRKLPDDYVSGLTEFYAQKKEIEPSKTVQQLVFRIGKEWLAFPLNVTHEIISFDTIHTIPHKSNTVLLGLVNVHGSVQLCFSLGNLLDIEEEESTGNNFSPLVFKRMIVCLHERELWVFPVDEIRGIHKMLPEDLNSLPDTVSNSFRTYTKGIFKLDNIQIGLLDHEIIISYLKRSAI